MEGGQTKEDRIKRDEIFFNEILARDEITQLAQPKVLTQGAVHSKDAEQPFESFKQRANKTIADNLVIEGNNLLALYCLEKQFTNKVKLIYIDPPFNTGGDLNTFTYNNNFNFSTYLTFMKNRLEIAKKLLTDDGFICVAIDHYELFYLGILLDEIFGRDNRLGVLTVLTNPMGRQKTTFFSVTNEYCLVYARDKQRASFRHITSWNTKPEHIEVTQVDEKGAYRLMNFLHDHKKGSKEIKEKNWYPIYVSSDCSKITLQETAGYHELLPESKSKIKRSWQTVRDKTQQKIDAGDIIAQQDGDSIILLYKNRENPRYNTVIYTHWDDKLYNANHHGSRYLQKIVDKPGVSNPKSPYLITDIVELLTDGDDIVLDFFAGSGTTAESVLMQNQKDNGSRQFIIVEQLKQHIKDCQKRIKSAIAKHAPNDSFIYFELKKYNERFREQIKRAATQAEILQIWEEMKAKAFFNYSVDFKKQEVKMQEMDWSLEQQKIELEKCLDRNQLYVNQSSLNDKDFACSDAEKKLTSNFYQISD